MYSRLVKEGNYTKLLEMLGDNPETDEEKYWLIYVLWNIGHVKKAYSKLLILEDEFMEEKWKKKIDILKIRLMINIGEYNKAKETCQELLKLAIIENDNQQISTLYYTMGLAFHRLGEVDSALIDYEMGLEYALSENQDELTASILDKIAKIHIDKGDLATGLEYFEKSLELQEEIGNPTVIGWRLKNIITVLIQQGDRKKAKKNLDRIESLHKENKIPWVTLDYEYSKAVYLKSSNRIRDKVDAERLFRKIIEETRDVEYQSYAIKHQLELLLMEYKIYQEQEVLDEIEDSINYLTKISKEQNIYSTLIESYILKSRLTAILGDLQESENLLDQAILIATEKELVSLKKQAEIVKRDMLKEFEELHHMILSNEDIIERFNKMNLLEYIKLARMKVE